MTYYMKLWGPVNWKKVHRWKNAGTICLDYVAQTEDIHPRGGTLLDCIAELDLMPDQYPFRPETVSIHEMTGEMVLLFRFEGYQWILEGSYKNG